MSFLSPTSIAVIGASTEEAKVGHMVLKNILTQGYKGAVYPVNPKAPEILGKKAYPSVAAIDGTVDLAVIVTPGKTVPGLLEECGAKGIRSVIVISAGFGETGTKEGHALEEEVVRITKQHKINLVGPNCLGIIRPSIGMNASFAGNLKKPGSIALLSQSGALAVALLDSAGKLGMDFSLVVSMGNKSVMSECDFLELCRDDPETHVIGMYLESIVDGKRFLKMAGEICKTKPIVLIKSGVSERGKKAVSSHTGALAGFDAAIDAMAAQTGIRRAHNTEEFLDFLRALAFQPPLLTPNIAIITNAGGPGILATDAADRQKLILAELEPKNAEALKCLLPIAASVKNPIDVLGDALGDRYGAALEACARDPNIDGVAVILTPQVMTPSTDIAKAIVELHKKQKLMPIVTSFMGDTNVAEAVKILHEHSIPNFSTPERAVAALAVLKTERMSPALNAAEGSTCDLSAGRRPVAVDLTGMHGLISEEDTATLFEAYGLPLPSSIVARDPDEAVTFAERLGYPLVVKISSSQILHKTDVGCVKVNIRTEKELRAAFTEVTENAKRHFPTVTLHGVLVQEYLPAGDEFIVGAIKDQNFGHLVMVGLGGIYTELFRDTAFRVAPVGDEEAYAMLQQLHSWKMLLGLRGKSQRDIVALAQVIIGVSKLVGDCPQIAELDLNPVIVREDSVVIADAKVVIE
ncbi:CoA-binding protein [Candidatus Peribacteria bacterium]|nr:CoA-binding protein [Candidatus Peribacteria bacterium]